jgi:uroporphyrin-III C-methyltransferase
LARLGQPIVLYMGMANIERIAGALISGGMAPDTAAAAIASATLAEERVLVSTLGALPGAVRAARLSAPVLVVIGEIVTIRTRLLELMPELEGALHWPVA